MEPAEDEAEWATQLSPKDTVFCCELNEAPRADQTQPRSEIAALTAKVVTSTDERAAINAFAQPKRRAFANQCFSTAESSCPCHHRCCFQCLSKSLKTSERREISYAQCCACGDPRRNSIRWRPVAEGLSFRILASCFTYAPVTLSSILLARTFRGTVMP